MEDYYVAKASLFTPERAVRAVVCVDDKWGQRLAKEASVPVVSISSRRDVAADWLIQASGPNPSTFELLGEGQRLSLRSALPGDFNRVNTAVAALVLLASGYPSEAVEQALAADPNVPGRMERVYVAGLPDSEQSRLPLAVVDFAHTPAAVAVSLEALRQHTSGSLIAVLGAGGDRDPGKREAMGAAAAAHADVVIVTDDNPRSEDPASIRAAVLAGTTAPDGAAEISPRRVRDIGDRATAIRAAVDVAAGGDTVVVLGRGCESEQDIGGVAHPFDDRSELRAALMEHVASGKHRERHTSTDVNGGEAL
jgi:UDP-N-acetylmuramoyl-L-alanyl-D-glutamate--2,6-diaminopimelate ligase